MKESLDLISEIKRKAVKYRVRHSVQASKAGLRLMRAYSPWIMLKGDSNRLSSSAHRTQTYHLEGIPFKEKPKASDVLPCFAG